MLTTPTVLLEKSLLTHPAHRDWLDRFLEVAFALSAQVQQPVAVQEIEGQLTSFPASTRPVWAPDRFDYVIMVWAAEQNAA